MPFAAPVPPVPWVAYVRSQPAAHTITLTPGLHRFADLAAELTRAGVPVRCDKAIASRLALVRLDPRPWSALRPLLEAALGVRFRDDGTGTFLMQEDPIQTRRERRQMAQMERLYSAPFGRAVRAAHALPGRWAGLDLEARHKAQQALYGGTPEEAASMIAYNQLYSFSQMSEATTVARLGRGFTLAGLLQGHLEATEPVSEIIRKAQAKQAPYEQFWNLTRMGIERAAQLLPESADLEPFYQELARATAREVIRIDPLTLAITGSFEFTVAPEGSPLRWGGRSDTQAASQGLPPRFGLQDVQPDAEEKAQLAQRQAATLRFLDQAEPTKPKRTGDGAAFVSPTPVPSVSLAPPERTFSAALWRWSQARDRQVIMEVSTLRDALPPKLAYTKQVSLRDCFLPFADVQSKMGYIASLSNGEGDRAERRHNADEARLQTRWVYMLPCLANDGWWTASEQGGVVIVRGEWQFLDHQTAPDTRAAVRLWQARQARKDSVPSVEDVIAAAEDVTPEQNAAALWTTLYDDARGFTAVYPYLDVLRQQDDLKALLRRLRSERSVNVTFSSLPDNVQRRFADSLRLLGRANQGADYMALIPFGDGLYRDTTLLARLQPLSLRVELKRYPGKGDWYWLTFSEVSAESPAAPERWETKIGPVCLP